ncbi:MULTISPECIES: hypothetical protein [Prochlorococcus]|uniref:hypothetical protein n=1 Tax=Prochlorococcus TaxID=1218 RepID=UPI000533B6E1|nr:MULTISPECIES: hypothetical protein [Prochlorococcus]KGG12522.1 hypothetical protein EV05_1734 [Prochlorococcus sp. MIT 0601]
MTNTINQSENNGMTIPEVTLAIAMLTTFTAVFVLVSQFTAGFFQPMAKSVNSKPYDYLNDFNDLQVIMDNLTDILAQPGYSREELDKFQCTNNPYEVWELPGKNRPLVPAGYNICITSSTNMIESPLASLSSTSDKSKPGIYILFAVPIHGVSGESLPVRRIFCRPSPYC